MKRAALQKANCHFFATHTSSRMTDWRRRAYSLGATPGLISIDISNYGVQADFLQPNVHYYGHLHVGCWTQTGESRVYTGPSPRFCRGPACTGKRGLDMAAELRNINVCRKDAERLWECPKREGMPPSRCTEEGVLTADVIALLKLDSALWIVHNSRADATWTLPAVQGRGRSFLHVNIDLHEGIRRHGS
ncbi:hypothetical protein P154DRAFT_101089 [Amniculicola lignicola CBS 123094]|uniref:Uncharacterized protein n=1 Tax=Amniculicola lignicola CBS 123094 TaxID=1392246 RepID=A0A6A5WNH0_9PLEO|nr:hypothetical protein P154DRAFT_101089 [Amniculicola lignicola CBS 123094]